MSVKPAIFGAMQLGTDRSGMAIKDQAIKPRTAFNRGNINMIGPQAKVVPATGQGLFKQNLV